MSTNLYNDLSAIIDNAIAVPGVVKQFYSSATYPDGPYVHNTACWAYPWRNALTCRAVWNTARRTMYGPTLVADTRGENIWCVTCAHLGSLKYTTCRFLGTDGTVYSRLIVDSKNWGEVQLCRLDSALPSTVIPAPIWPWYDYMYVYNNPYLLPVATLKADKYNEDPEVIIQDAMSIQGAVFVKTHDGYPPDELNRRPFWEDIQDGASGSPIFSFFADGTVVLLSQGWTSVAHGESIAAYLPWISNLMTEMMGDGLPRSLVVKPIVGYDILLSAPPAITLSVDPLGALPGSQVNLSWQVAPVDYTGATSINQSIGAVPSVGQTTVTPLTPTTYTLTATNPSGTTTKSITITPGTRAFTYFLWAGASSADMGVLSNWRASDVNFTNVGPATHLPQAGDICWITAGVTVTGSCYGDMKPSDPNSFSIGVNGGTFYGICYEMPAGYHYATINGVGLNMGYSQLGSLPSYCTFNGPVTLYTDQIGDNTPFTCTFNGILNISSANPPTSFTVYGPTAMTAAIAGQLAVDQAAVAVASDNILNTANILGQGGTFKLDQARAALYAAGAAGQKARDQHT